MECFIPVCKPENKIVPSGYHDPFLSDTHATLFIDEDTFELKARFHDNTIRTFGSASVGKVSYLIEGDGSTIEFGPIIHSKNSYNILVSMTDTSTYQGVPLNWKFYGAAEVDRKNKITVEFAEAPAVGQNYRVTII